MPASKDLPALLRSVSVASQLAGETRLRSGSEENIGFIQPVAAKPFWGCAAPASVEIKTPFLAASLQRRLLLDQPNAGRDGRSKVWSCSGLISTCCLSQMLMKEVIMQAENKASKPWCIQWGRLTFFHQACF